MKKINVIFFCLLALLFNNCEKTTEQPVTELPAIYQGCCGTKPVEFNLGTASV